MMIKRVSIQAMAWCCTGKQVIIDGKSYVITRLTLWMDLIICFSNL